MTRKPAPKPAAAKSNDKNNAGRRAKEKRGPKAKAAVVEAVRAAVAAEGEASRAPKQRGRPKKLLSKTWLQIPGDIAAEQDSASKSAPKPVAKRASKQKEAQPTTDDDVDPDDVPPPLEAQKKLVTSSKIPLLKVVPKEVVPVATPKG